MVGFMYTLGGVVALFVSFRLCRSCVVVYSPSRLMENSKRCHAIVVVVSDAVFRTVGLCCSRYVWFTDFCDFPFGCVIIGTSDSPCDVVIGDSSWDS